MKKMKELTLKETKRINGGGTNPLITPVFWWGYIAAEVLEGIQRGLSKDCSDACK